MDCTSASNKGTSIRKFFKWKSFLLALSPFEISSYSKRIQSSSKGIRVDKLSKLDLLISSFILPVVFQFVLAPIFSHYQEISCLVYNLIIYAKSCQLLPFCLCNVIIVAICFKNSKPFEKDQEFSLDETPHLSVQNEKKVQVEKNDVASEFEKKEEVLLITDAYEIGNSDELNSFKPAVENSKEQEEIVTLLDNVQEGYVSDYENDNENCDSSNFGDSDNDDHSDDSSNFGDDDDDDNDDLNFRAEEFIAKTNERWRAERLREYHLYR